MTAGCEILLLSGILIWGPDSEAVTRNVKFLLQLIILARYNSVTFTFKQSCNMISLCAFNTRHLSGC